MRPGRFRSDQAALLTLTIFPDNGYNGSSMPTAEQFLRPSLVVPCSAIVRSGTTLLSRKPILD
jgi:hypothetical protein